MKGWWIIEEEKCPLPAIGSSDLAGDDQIGDTAFAGVVGTGIRLSGAGVVEDELVWEPTAGGNMQRSGFSDMMYDTLFAKKYRLLDKRGEGTFSVVFRCQSLSDGKTYAVKKMKSRYPSIEQVNALQEVRCLKRLNPHPNIIGLHEVLYDPRNGSLSLACELMDLNLYELIKDRSEFLPEAVVKKYTFQLLKALDHMHRKHLFHRDVKPENILIRLTDNALKLADFGSSRSSVDKYPFTEYISTRWYRAPECLLTDGYYGSKMDVWSAGCVFFEIFRLQPLFPGRSEIDQINRIHSILGTPSKEQLCRFRQSRHMSFEFRYHSGTGLASLLQHASTACLNILRLLCCYDPDKRCTAKEALQHSYFREIRERRRRRESSVEERSSDSAEVPRAAPVRRKPKSESQQPQQQHGGLLPVIHTRHDNVPSRTVVPLDELARAQGSDKFGAYPSKPDGHHRLPVTKVHRSVVAAHQPGHDIAELRLPTLSAGLPNITSPGYSSSQNGSSTNGSQPFSGPARPAPKQPKHTKEGTKRKRKPSQNPYTSTDGILPPLVRKPRDRR